MQNWRGFLILPNPLANFEIQKCYQSEPNSKVVIHEIN